MPTIPEIMQNAIKPNAASITSTETADGAIVNITGGQAFEAFDFGGRYDIF